MVHNFKVDVSDSSVRDAGLREEDPVSFQSEGELGVELNPGSNPRPLSQFCNINPC